MPRSRILRRRTPLKKGFVSHILRKQANNEPLTISELNQVSRYGGGVLLEGISLFDPAELESAQEGIDSLYDKTLADLESTSIWYPSVELEMLEYFRSNPEAMYSMPSRKFEELVAAIFRNNGFAVELTPETRDNGVDIIAVQNSALTGESIHLIECKRNAPDHSVGIGIVQRLLGVVTHMRATKGIVVTTSYFTAPARAVAQSSKHVLTLRDYDAVRAWLRSIVLST